MSKVFSTKNITRLAVFSALAIILYIFPAPYGKISLPFIFPKFLELQISEMPALLAGYMMGPIAGTIVILIKTIVKLPFTGTACVGEFGDFLIGITFVLTSSLIYGKYRTKKGALISLAIGSLCSSIVALPVNAFILIPFYSTAYGMSAIIGMMSSLFPAITEETLMLYYLPLSVLPFNLLRCVISSVITFLIYKKLGILFDRLFDSQEKYLIIGGKKCILKSVISSSFKDTFNFGKKLGKALNGGEIILLKGELGAGKTVIAKGIAAGLNIKDEIVSPTFTLLNCYEGKLKLYHYDAYRLDDSDEAEEKGLTEYFGVADGVCVIEWAEKIMDVIPRDNIEISIEYDAKGKRKITVSDNRKLDSQN